MSLLGLLGNVAKGAVVGVAAVTALPILGAVGTITATGTAVGSVVGAAAGVYDHVNDEKK